MLIMKGIPGANHLDRARRHLAPRDYAQPPEHFGRVHDAAFTVPLGGDAVSCEVARLQHELVLAWRSDPWSPSLAALGRRFGVSTTTLSRTVCGQRWMGDLVATILVFAVRHAHRPRSASPGGAHHRRVDPR